MTGAGIFRIIISKFSHKKELNLIILFIIDKNLETGLYYMVLPLSLAINLGVKSSKEFLLNLKEVA